MHYVVWELHTDRPATRYGWTLDASTAVQWVTDLALVGRLAVARPEVTVR